jgi:hypothetical protein
MSTCTVVMEKAGHLSGRCPAEMRRIWLRVLSASVGFDVQRLGDGLPLDKRAPLPGGDLQGALADPVDLPQGAQAGLVDQRGGIRVKTSLTLARPQYVPRPLNCTGSNPLGPHSMATSSRASSDLQHGQSHIRDFQGLRQRDGLCAQMSTPLAERTESSLDTPALGLPLGVESAPAGRPWTALRQRSVRQASALYP